jgi:ferric-dicitrate binding protein FerR (iron transport regulator)
MKPDELDRLIHRYFERDLTREEEALLAQLIRTDAAVADRFVELSELESALVESLAAEEAAPPEVSTPLRQTRRRTQVLRLPEARPVWPLFFAAGLMVGFVALLLSSAEKPAAPAVAVRLEPPSEKPAPAPAAVRPADRVEAPRRVEAAREVDDFHPQVFPPAPVVGTPAVAKDPAPEPEPRRQEKQGPAAEKAPASTDVRVADAKIEKVEGDVVRIADLAGPVASGQRLLSGQGLEVRKGAALLVLEDGTRVELRAATRLDKMTLGPAEKRFHLSRGAVAAAVAKQAPKTSVLFQTPHAEVTVIGTRLSLEIGNDSTRVEVSEGLVRCMRLSDKYVVDIPAGKFAMASKGAAPVARPTPVVRSFQDGVLPTPGYAGTQDTEIASAQPTQSFGTTEQLELQRLSESRSALFRWDISSIPPGSRVTAAELSFWVTGAIVGDCKVFGMAHGWDEAATWKTSNGVTPWFGPGAQGNKDRGSRPVGLLAPPSSPGMTTMPLNEMGLALVQDWVNDPAGKNFGILILGPDVNKWGLEARETAVPERRPKLTVTYLAGK